MSLVSNQFSGHSLFQKALKDSFVEIVNKDVGKYRTADLLSSSCDRILKTGSTEKFSDNEAEEYLEKVVKLFSYLTDKDLFAEIYRNQLAKRLLNQVCHVEFTRYYSRITITIFFLAAISF